MTKSKIFQDVLAERNDLLHRHAIWEEVVSHLQKFVDKDAEPAKNGIATKGEGVTVPQSVIEAVVQEINLGPITEILSEIQGIDKSKVAENVSEEQKNGKEGKKGRKGQNASRPAKGGPS
jgi:hypothetical protein